MSQFLSSAKAVLGGLLERHSGAQITEKLSRSILAITTRQLVTSHFLSPTPPRC